MRNPIAVLPLATIILIVLSPTAIMADFIPPNLPPGSQYQLIFVTADFITATSSDINYYNTFVTNEAALNPSLPQGVTWHAVASTETANAYLNAAVYPGIPIYDTQGNLVVAASESLYAGGDFINPPMYDQYGHPTDSTLVWTGSTASGDSFYSLSLGDNNVEAGVPTSPVFADFLNDTTGPAIESLPMYGLSRSITIGANLPEPATISLLGSALLVIGGVSSLRWTRKRNWKKSNGSPRRS